MQTCLEIRSIEARHEMEVRSDYNHVNQYNSSHPDALSNGDWQGKGTGHPGHTFWLPNNQLPQDLFNFTNFDTSFESHPGNGDDKTPNTDNWARRIAMTRSIYSAVNPYREYNDEIYDGQYQVP